MRYRGRHVRPAPPPARAAGQPARADAAGATQEAATDAAGATQEAATTRAAVTTRAAATTRAAVATARPAGSAAWTARRTALSAAVSSRRGACLLVTAGAVALAAALARFGLHAADPSFLARMYDLGIYRDGGLIVRHAYHFRSGQPTPLYDWVSPGGGNPFTYPPFAAGIFAVISFLPAAVLQWGMTALSLGALAAAVWLTLGAAGLPAGLARTGTALLVLAAALWTQPVQSTLGLGQVNLLLMTAIIWDLRPAGIAGAAQGDRRGGRWWTGAATGVAAGIKLTPLIFIPYLLVTRRFRQAAVATGAFAVTVAAGFAVMPGASAAYWRSGLLDRANGTPRANVEFFFASAWNQSLRGVLSRFMLHAQVAAGPWLMAAALTAIIGLTCATWLHRDGYPMLGLLACALTGLMISPISWLHHWVWVAPWLAALAAMAIRARGAARARWAGITAVVALVFADGPTLPSLTGSQRALNLITDVPMKHSLGWHGIELVAGNAYAFAGAAALLALFGWGVARSFRPGLAWPKAPLAEQAR